MQSIDAKDAGQWQSMRTLLNEAEAFDGSPPISDQALIAASQGKRAVFASEEVVGIVGEGELDLVVHPRARGKGVGGAAFNTLLEHHAASGGGTLRVWTHGQHPAADALLRRTGFTPSRELLLLSLAPEKLPAAIEDARPLPEGFTIEAFDAVPVTEAAPQWLRVNAAAFASHPEQGQVTLKDFEALRQESWFDASDLRLAWTTGPEPRRLAGFTWVKTLRSPLEVATELYVLGVDPEFAGIGLGAALLGETLRCMQRHETNRITLYVDGDNLGARALYERAGFDVAQRSTQWSRFVANKR